MTSISVIIRKKGVLGKMKMHLKQCLHGWRQSCDWIIVGNHITVGRTNRQVIVVFGDYWMIARTSDANRILFYFFAWCTWNCCAEQLQSLFEQQQRCNRRRLSVQPNWVTLIIGHSEVFSLKQSWKLTSVTSPFIIPAK